MKKYVKFILVVLAVVLAGSLLMRFLHNGILPPGGHTPIQSVYSKFKNGVIQECPTNGKMYYSASNNNPDEAQSIFNAAGAQIGSVGGFSPTSSSLKEYVDMTHCVTVYSNLPNAEKVNKYGLY